MFNEDSSIYLSIKPFVNDIICLAIWCHIVTQNGPIIKFGNPLGLIVVTSKLIHNFKKSSYGKSLVFINTVHCCCCKIPGAI